MIAAVPISLAIGTDSSSSSDPSLISLEGTVKAFVCCNDTDDCCNDSRAGSFILETDDGNETVVEFGPWWYWDYVAANNGTTVRDIIAVGDRANVTGVLNEKDDGSVVLEAWSITNVDTGQTIIIKEEACPPWAGGPKELGIVPWPPSHGDE